MKDNCRGQRSKTWGCGFASHLRSPRHVFDQTRSRHQEQAQPEVCGAQDHRCLQDTEATWALILFLPKTARWHLTPVKHLVTLKQQGGLNSAEAPTGTQEECQGARGAERSSVISIGSPLVLLLGQGLSPLSFHEVHGAPVRTEHCPKSLLWRSAGQTLGPPDSARINFDPLGSSHLPHSPSGTVLGCSFVRQSWSVSWSKALWFPTARRGGRTGCSFCLRGT